MGRTRQATEGAAEEQDGLVLACVEAVADAGDDPVGGDDLHDRRPRPAVLSCTARGRSGTMPGPRPLPHQLGEGVHPGSVGPGVGSSEAPRTVDTVPMPDLSEMLGDVYGEPTRSRPSRRRRPEPRRRSGPTTSTSIAAFAEWTPGPGADAPAAERGMFASAHARAGRLADDLAAALSEAVLAEHRR